MLLARELRLSATSSERMATEPGKATTDKEIEPVVNGSQAAMEPLGNVAKRRAVMDRQEAFGDFKKASMVESFGHQTFILKSFDRGVAKGDPHDGPRLDASPHSGENGDLFRP
jgi:hypothetical protein